MSVMLRTASFVRGSVPRLTGCLYCTKSNGPTDKPQKTAKEQPKPVAAAPPTKPAQPEEPFDNTKYQCGSYLNHSEWSYYNIEAQMTARRVGQPSSKTTPVA